MPKLILSFKLLSMFLYNAILSQITTGVNQPNDVILYFFIFMMFMPETLLIFSKGFREWVKQGVENSDGKLSKSDLKDGVILYGSLWCLRVFLFMSWSKVFYGTNIEFYFYLTPLLGSFGISGLPIVKSIMGIR